MRTKIFIVIATVFTLQVSNATDATNVEDDSTQNEDYIVLAAADETLCREQFGDETISGNNQLSCNALIQHNGETGRDLALACGELVWGFQSICLQEARFGEIDTALVNQCNSDNSPGFIGNLAIRASTLASFKNCLKSGSQTFRTAGQ